jgi:hypothetical protein
MKKQYINPSNEAPSMHLGSALLYAIAIDFYNLPDWVWGVWGALTFIFVVAFIYRFLTEDGVDVVNRKD